MSTSLFFWKGTVVEKVSSESFSTPEHHPTYVPIEDPKSLMQLSHFDTLVFVVNVHKGLSKLRLQIKTILKEQLNGNNTRGTGGAAAPLHEVPATEDSKANARFVEIFASHHNGWH
ncbi:hypothetical protein QJS10_CPB21g01183 [Acorus calamus]|uniref:Uncharacterized protein n=1 Tax=Acorus calamus TaxID=4465 RepID=A0AAV9C7P5_ACOCL|nr:hypothetical protein QJS10_CPB21g01183 [Acorus calamus]